MSEFRRLADFIHQQCGIHLPEAKRIMVEGRLQRRLRDLDMTDFGRYFELVSDPAEGSGELVRLLDAVSTNKTEFFREAQHFDFLAQEALPETHGRCVEEGRTVIRAWSAGCSSGEEAYTIAMVLSEFCSARRTRFSVLATDISTRVLECGRRAIYTDDAIRPVPPQLRTRYLMRGRGRMRGLSRVTPELRGAVTFRRMNLNGGRSFDLRESMDIIFCRNVIIYFTRETQRVLFDKFYERLAPGGYLFIGHCETLHGISDRFTTVGQSVYRRPVGGRE